MTFDSINSEETQRIINTGTMDEMIDLDDKIEAIKTDNPKDFQIKTSLLLTIRLSILSEKIGKFLHDLINPFSWLIPVFFRSDFIPKYQKKPLLFGTQGNTSESIDLLTENGNWLIR